MAGDGCSVGGHEPSGLSQALTGAGLWLRWTGDYRQASVGAAAGVSVPSPSPPSETLPRPVEPRVLPWGPWYPDPGPPGSKAQSPQDPEMGTDVLDAHVALENVSLADILSLRDSGLSEQEAWAVCLECSLSMRSVAHAAIFQTLCITPDTLAFNASGNVCFMELLSDDPEGAFVPPEFDVTGNTFEAHIYSLGATLKAALEYVAEPEPEPEPRLSQDLEALLSQMQAENPRDRPDLQSIIALCEKKMLFTSSCRLCRSLSAVGRRVLSIESFGAFQDVSESSCSGRPATGSTGPRKQPGGRTADPEGPAQRPAHEAHGAPEQPAALPSKPLLSAPVRNGERLASLVLDAQRPLGDPERSCLRKVQTFPRLLPDGPEASALCLTLGPQLPPSELFPPDPRKAFLEGMNGLSSYKTQPSARLRPEQEPEIRRGGPGGAGRGGDGASGAPGWGPTEESPAPRPKAPGDAGREPGTCRAEEGILDGAGEPASTATEQGISLQDLLCQLGRPFKEYELWALSHACLSALRAHSEHPAYLCLDSVLVAEDGAILFGPPPANGTYDTFFLAPEVADQELVTEKASVYCVAAVLWTAAKFSVPRDHKLALPRRLKTLLLDMARRSAQERPCAAEAIKAVDDVCCSPPDHPIVSVGSPGQGGASEEAVSQPQGDGTSAPSGCSLSSKRPSLHGAGKEKPATTRVSRAPCPPPPLSDVDADELSRGNFEVGFRPQKSVKAEREQQPEAGEHGQQGGGPEAVARLPRPKDGGLAVNPGPADLQSCSPGWCSAFYEADCFGADVYSYVQELARQKAGGAVDADAQSPELEQQLMIEKRNYRKTLKFYQKLLQKEKRNKGSEVKTMLSKLKGQLEEMKCKVQFLGLVKKYLQVMYAERWGLEPCALPVIVNISAAHCDTLDFSPLDESSSLIFYNVSKHPRGGRQRKARVLQAGTPLGLMAYLYSSDAFLEGYVQQFLYTFRYFCTPHDFLHFLLDRINSTLSRAHQDPTSTFTKIYKRSFCLLQAWLEDCYTVDFTRNSGLLGRLEDFLSSKILPLDGSAEHLLGLLEVGTDRRAEGTSRGTDLEGPKEAEEDTRPLNALCKRLSEDGISRKVGAFPGLGGRGVSWGRGSTAQRTCPEHLRPCLRQELFQKCHPVHFLNSRALGVMDKSVAIPKASSSEPPTAKTCSLFLPNYVQDKYLLQLLRSADDVSTWVAAEIVTSHTSKLQVNLLSKFLLIAKSCYEQRNFATAMQILGGLEHLAVRQSPAWRILPAKIAEVMEELKAVEVFLKSDSLCLMEGRRFRAQPTLPSARLLAMHIQQLETGGFTMTNGAHRWSKLRNIAKVVSQVHAFQENPYTFAPDHKLQSYLKQRIARFSGADISTLAADNRASFHQITSEKHSRKIQDKLRRMKATFQ
ncbi:kinase non-catalytic C-lobe domain-containing protein 1 [Puma concolor]|uniref:Kinase non-catalytic C-lobe domain-containing protein 1 n=1 Tax=Puma concolor TaxID=9696 RepID=A0A6P6HFJ0_PUMCO|nr:kinase non-catalytic C-lobe domain-containing protein 1 [Puma concolor]